MGSKIQLAILNTESSNHPQHGERYIGPPLFWQTAVSLMNGSENRLRQLRWVLLSSLYISLKFKWYSRISELLLMEEMLY